MIFEIWLKYNTDACYDKSTISLNILKYSDNKDITRLYFQQIWSFMVLYYQDHHDQRLKVIEYLYLPPHVNFSNRSYFHLSHCMLKAQATRLWSVVWSSSESFYFSFFLQDVHTIFDTSFIFSMSETLQLHAFTKLWWTGATQRVALRMTPLVELFIPRPRVNAVACFPLDQARGRRCNCAHCSRLGAACCAT